MKKIILILCTVLLIVGCNNTEQKLRERAYELCKYIPDHTLLKQSKDYLTDDFYAILDTMFNLPEHEAMDHEWLYYFVTSNGGTIADYEVVKVKITSPTNAVATINVRQQWEDGTFDDMSDIEEHRLYMEKVNNKWLMSDFDEHKADCIRYIEINRQEQAVRQAISNYLIDEIGVHYLQGELCIPTLMMVYETDSCVWGDFWIFWYNRSGDTLKTVSGGNHAGLISLYKEKNTIKVRAFEQVKDGTNYLSSAKQIFGKHYDIFWNMHNNMEVVNAVRQEQLREYIHRTALSVTYYQDYGWPAVKL